MTLRFGLVAKPLNLLGRPGATINAKGQTPLKVGPVTLPGSVGIAVLGTSHVRVSGFTVGHAGFDAILIARSSHVWASRNELLHNGDVGVDINGSSWSGAVGNVAEGRPLAFHDRRCSTGYSACTPRPTGQLTPVLWSGQ